MRWQENVQLKEQPRDLGGWRESCLDVELARGKSVMREKMDKMGWGELWRTSGKWGSIYKKKP